VDAERTDRPDLPLGPGSGDGAGSPPPGGTARPTLNGAVRRRRADRAFYLRLADIMRQNEHALERLR